jgi:hypothetical protein
MLLVNTSSAKKVLDAARVNWRWSDWADTAVINSDVISAG